MFTTVQMFQGYQLCAISALQAAASCADEAVSLANHLRHADSVPTLSRTHAAETIGTVAPRGRAGLRWQAGERK